MAKKRQPPRTYYYLIGHLQRLIPTIGVDSRIDIKERGEIETLVASLTSVLSRVNQRQFRTSIEGEDWSHFDPHPNAKE